MRLQVRQQRAELRGCALDGRCRIVQLVREPGRQFAERHELLAMGLVDGLLADAVGHHPHEALADGRQVAQQVREVALVQPRHPAAPRGTPARPHCRHARVRQHAGHVAFVDEQEGLVGLGHQDVQLAREQRGHPVGHVTHREQLGAGFVDLLLHPVGQPATLPVVQGLEDVDVPQCIDQRLGEAVGHVTSPRGTDGRTGSPRHPRRHWTRRA